MAWPNILLITTDQQRFDTIAALGNHHIYTPHLDYLVDEGIAFTRCYSECPVCMPARATIMTGLSAETHGLLNNGEKPYPMKDRKTFPQLLTENGYQTRAEGKLHFSPMRATYGIEHADLPMEYFNEMRKYNRPSTREHGLGENEMEPVINNIDERDTLTHWIVEKSMYFLDNRDTTRPFFLWTSFPKPHPPFDPCLPYWELYRDEKMPEPWIGDWANEPGTPQSGFYFPTERLNGAGKFSKEQIRRIRQAYYACLTQIDYNLGLLFAKMRELNLMENTWIIFTSDHGEMLGDHYMGAKTVFFEGAAHIPFLIKPPAALGNSHPTIHVERCSKLMTLNDLAPTILSIAGIKVPEEMEGRNLLTYRNSDEPETVVWGNTANQYLSVVRGHHKYTWARMGGNELLFDLENDPHELHDLSKSPEHQSLRNELRTMLIAHFRKVASDCIGENNDLIPQPPLKDMHISRFPGLNTTVFPRDSFH